MNAKDWTNAVLRGESPAWPAAGDDEAAIDDVVRTALHDGVGPLLHTAISRRYHDRQLPSRLRDALLFASQHAAARDLAWHAELGAVLTGFEAIGLRCLLIKGTPLAYSIYSQPYLRERGDTDILFPDHRQAEAAFDWLAGRGYSRCETISGDTIITQFSGSRRLPGGSRLTLDMHWRLNNFVGIARCYEYGELDGRAQSVPALHPLARAPSNVDALIIACLHRASHRAEGMHNRSIWLYDIHLLVKSFGEEEQRLLIERCLEKRVSAVVGDGIRAAGLALATPIPAGLQEGLDKDDLPQAVTMNRYASRWRRELTQLGELPGAGQQVAHIAHHLFPAPAYLLGKYKKTHRAWLPLLYARRIGEGIARRFRR